MRDHNNCLGVTPDRESSEDRKEAKCSGTISGGNNKRWEEDSFSVYTVKQTADPNLFFILIILSLVRQQC